MRIRMISRSCIACAAAALLFSGCKSGPDVAGTVDNMGKFGVETAKVNDGIDAALKSLDALVNTQGEDLKTPFEAYTKSVSALDEQAKVVRARAQEMQAKGDEYFKSWDAQGETSDMSAERRAKLAETYAKIKDDSLQAGDAFQPFLASLKDVQGYLNLDLSRKGVDSVKDLAKKARANGDQVKAKIEDVIQQTNSVRGMLSTKPAK